MEHIVNQIILTGNLAGAPRYSHENPDIREIYSDFFGKPMSHKAHMLLHTEHWKNN